MAICVKCNKKGIFVKVNKDGLCNSCAEQLAKEENQIRCIAHENSKLALCYANSISDNAKNVISNYENGLCKDRELAECAVNLMKEAVEIAGAAISAVKNAPINEVISVVREASDKLEVMNKKSSDLLSLSMNVAPKQEYEHIKFNVKGVTFKNEDGSRRQTILRRLKFRDPPFDGKIITSLEEYEFDGEKALAICVNDLQIGSLPKELLNIAFEHIDDNLCISAVDVCGGGKDENGEQRNYGAEAYLRYDK